jgi:hypothetical protein
MNSVENKNMCYMSKRSVSAPFCAVMKHGPGDSSPAGPRTMASKSGFFEPSGKVDLIVAGTYSHIVRSRPRHTVPANK